jgi:purine-nucleoside phosphorylase
LPETPRHRLVRAAERITRRAGGAIEVAIVLGSGLAAGFRPRIDGVEVAYEKLRAPASSLAGHPGVAYVGTFAGKRTVAFAGRAHLYQGHTPAEVTYFVQLAAAAGARTIVLTNAAGGLNPDYRRGDLMLIRDHINLTGTSPIDGRLPDPFLNMNDAYAPRLRELARDAADGIPLHEGVYAGLRGPQYETPAECEALRRIGADVVGMSTVLETIAARSLGLEVLGISLVTNETGAADEVSHADVLTASQAGAERLAAVIERTIRRA